MKIRQLPQLGRFERLWCWIRRMFDKEAESNLVAHAKRELLAAGYDLAQQIEDPNKWFCENVIELLTVFSKQGHSGSSAFYISDAFNKLSRFQPLCPLTGEDSEWQQLGDGEWQNRRCSHVFKDKAGQAYDINGRVFRDPDGVCYTNRESRVPVTFPYSPKSEVVDRLRD